MAIYNASVQYQLGRSSHRNVRRTSNPGEVEDLSLECQSRLDPLDGESLGLSLSRRPIRDDSDGYEDLEGMMG